MSQSCLGQSFSPALTPRLSIVNQQLKRPSPLSPPSRHPAKPIPLHNTMASTLLRQSALRTAVRSAAPSSAKRAALASTTFTRGKATLPDLPCMSIRPQSLDLQLLERAWTERSMNGQLTSVPIRRLWRPRASYLWSDHGAAPLEAPQHLRYFIQHSDGEDAGGTAKGRYPGTDCSAANDQLPWWYVWTTTETTSLIGAMLRIPRVGKLTYIRRPHQPHPLLGEPRTQKPGRRRATKRRPFQVYRLPLRLARQPQVADEHGARRHPRLGLGMASARRPNWRHSDPNICEPGSCRWPIPPPARN